jgi:hypothetical protein
MVQLLTTIIEWFAVMALSIIGVDYDPAQPCIPTEYAAEPAAIVFMTDSAWMEPAQLIADCASSTLIPVELSPVELKSHDRFDS